MSIEALWAIRYAPEMMREERLGAGVVVFETGRIFGGDSFCYFTGAYEFKSEQELIVRVQVRIHTNFEDSESIFGGALFEYDLFGVGQISADHKSISIYAGIVNDPQKRELRARLERIAELP